MTNPHQTELDWYGLYPVNGSRDDVLFTEESVSHPAKMSLPLTHRILKQMQEWGWLKTGDVVADPFGGRGTTPLVWCGLHPDNRAVTVELEGHFVQMQESNKAHAEKRLGRPVRWTIIQGDSRKADELMSHAIGRAGLTSPPYEDTPLTGERNFRSRFQPEARSAAANGREGYGGPATAVLSPPYGQGVIAKSDPERLRALTEDPTSSLYGRNPEGRWFKAMEAGYVNSPGNIDNCPDVAVTSPPYEAQRAEPNYSEERLAKVSGPIKDRIAAHQGSRTGGYGACITSPPYEGSLASDDPEKRGGLFRDPKRANDRTLTGTYAGVTSPPYEAQSGGHKDYTDGALDSGVLARHSASRIANGAGYAANVEGQIGATQGECYADAVLEVYRAMARANVRYLAVVTKNPTRNGKLRRLDKLTARLLRQAGYRVVAWRRAWLWMPQADEEKRVGQASLFDDVEPSKRTTGRLSFFKRIQLAKGSVAAQWEDILFAELV